MGSDTMANELKVEQQQALLNLRRQSWGIRRIARQLGISRNTVRAYLRGLGLQTDPPLTAGSPGQNQQMSAQTMASDSGETQQIDPPLTAGTSGPQSQCAVHAALILEKVNQGLSAQRVYQDLKIEVSFAGAYESVKRYVRKLRRVAPELVQRLEVQPGEEVQVDFGSGVPS